MTEPIPQLPAAQRVPVTDDFPTGPALGAHFPEFTLRNQRNEPINLEAARAGRRGLIVFQRSARW